MNEFKLNKEPKIDSGFKIPENYFEDFSAKVINQLNEKETKVISLFSIKKIWYYAAAAILIVGLMIPLLQQNNQKTTEIDQTTIENYLADNASISDDELLELLDESDIQKLKSAYVIEDNTIEEMLSTNSNLEEYLID